MRLVLDDEEVYYDGSAMITETDLNGRIIFANRKFHEMSGYTMNELIGRPHSIIRHYDMPKGCFKEMWETLSEGCTWQGYIKNLRKDRRFYWVVVFITPKFQDEKLCGYIAVRKKPEPEMLELAKEIYLEALQLERSGLMSEARDLITRVQRRDVVGFPFERMESPKRCAL